ncbi:hypothetical protein BGY98DRAFT_995904 [Russula aff. rugulosa BPL654]|nr:hypothetical protein BGY98DRAFT_995904 [Russula aff. rugulosa BPL654]
MTYGPPRPRSTRSTSWCFSCRSGYLVGFVDYIQLDAGGRGVITFVLFDLSSIGIISGYTIILWGADTVPPSILYGFLCSIWVTVVEEHL